MLLFLALTAYAQETDALTDEVQPRAQYKAVTIVEFDRLRVDGKLEGPTGSLVYEPKRGTHMSLIRLRANFDDEVEGSVDQLK